MSPPLSRRLAAILAADIVGYSALMGADQEGTLAALRQLRSEVFGPAVAGHRGKVVKSMGDGWLVEFAAATDAVTCAMQLQDALTGHNMLRLRIGIHIGDVVHEEEDVFGDGVNIAARLETLAVPGAVLISDAVHGSLDGTLRPSFDALGVQALKNIDRQVQVWCRGAGPDADAPVGLATAGREQGRQTGFPRLEITPVGMLGENPEVRELADALTSDLTTFLGSVRWLSADTQPTAGEDAYVLTGRLRVLGERLRLEAQLKGPDGKQLWTDKFDGTIADSFDWQDSTAEAIAAGVMAAILDTDTQQLAAIPVEERTLESLDKSLSNDKNRLIVAIEARKGASLGLFSDQ